MRCGKCKMTSYCSKQCQKAHHLYHSDYCSMIVDLKKIEIGKLYKNQSVRQVQIDDKFKRRLVKLIGNKPMLSCQLDGRSLEMLWDITAGLRCWNWHCDGRKREC